MLLRNHFSFLT